MSATTFSQAVLMCHAPIVIPAFGGPRAPLCAASTRAMEEAARILVENHSDGIVILSPHTPRYRTAYGLVEGTNVWGDFEPFGRSDISLEFASDPSLQGLIKSMAMEHDVSVKPVPPGPLDHGALVPLHFLKAAGYDGKIVVIGFPQEPSLEKNRNFGILLEKSVTKSKGRWALLASGDMSHRLTPGAPAGFHPEAERFDRIVRKCVESGEFLHISDIDHNLRENAAEDVVDSLEITFSALRDTHRNHHVLSYEGPFGVGYLIAVLHQETTPS
jgi:aromatic ring-opening dioxygenase LigB subunit